MSFRKILSAFRAADLPLNPQQVPGEFVNQNDNTDLICSRYGVLYTQDAGQSGLIGDLNASYVLNAGGVGLAENVYPISLFCVAGDPADTFASDPCYLQLHGTVAVLTPGAVPYLVWPVPIPPAFLQYDFRYPQTPGVTADIPGPFQLVLSSTRNTYTAGPVGEIWVSYTTS